MISAIDENDVMIDNMHKLYSCGRTSTVHMALLLYKLYDTGDGHIMTAIYGINLYRNLNCSAYGSRLNGMDMVAIIWMPLSR